MWMPVLECELLVNADVKHRLVGVGIGSIDWGEYTKPM